MTCQHASCSADTCSHDHTTTHRHSHRATEAQPVNNDRRQFLQKLSAGVQAATFASLSIYASPLLADARKKERVIEFYVPRTGESIRSVFWTPSEGYISESISELSIAMRDGRTDEVKRMNTKTLDIIAALQNMLRPNQPTHLISAYRSPVTNRRIGGAKESYHVKAMASDIKMPGIGYNTLLNAAKRLNAGGVGRYTRSGFVHVDSGPVRYWSTVDQCDCGNHDIA